MEVALESNVPTYSGGLGVLAGDMLRSAADLGVPMVGVTLVHRRGYFFQRLDEAGRQHEEPVAWSPDDWLEPTGATCQVVIAGRAVTVRAWRYPITGVSGRVVPVLLLDTDVPENDSEARHLTDQLYGGDDHYRLAQEMILGIGGVRILRALFADDRIVRFHMNEGHSALLALELLSEELARSPADRAGASERVKRRCVFTTHTPVPAGHDQFPVSLAERVLSKQDVEDLRALECCEDVLNMTNVALRLSHYVNGVARRHGEVSRSILRQPISSITNGVHSASWTAPPFAALYDRYIPDWRRNNFALRYALSIPLEEVRAAHREAKRQLMDEVNERTNAGFDQDRFTVGFARRATAYKRPTLVLRDRERLRRLAAEWGPLQIVFAGKAHPRDLEGKGLIEEIARAGRELAPLVQVAYLPNYTIEVARLVTAGVDLWLNTPKPPHEASGTSGMKAAHNGVPSLSVLDGWWWEGHVEGVTGWAVGPGDRGASVARSDEDDAREIYRLLEGVIFPLSRDVERWSELMRRTIALNASFFNSQRMLHEYVMRAYVDDARSD
jgi:starch phosphorylase